eukprot:GGOE01044568.1.p1 GENE.GGOE01044568.1~~GGOE01044568.1.p1  ORF type:complete len:250 (+),score=13.51 GGOE01044568.1:83-751(+)
MVDAAVQVGFPTSDELLIPRLSSRRLTLHRHPSLRRSAESITSEAPPTPLLSPVSFRGPSAQCRDSAPSEPPLLSPHLSPMARLPLAHGSSMRRKLWPTAGETTPLGSSWPRRDTLCLRRGSTLSGRDNLSFAPSTGNGIPQSVSLALSSAASSPRAGSEGRHHSTLSQVLRVMADPHASGKPPDAETAAPSPEAISSSTLLDLMRSGIASVDLDLDLDHDG